MPGPGRCIRLTTHAWRNQIFRLPPKVSRVGGINSAVSGNYDYGGIFSAVLQYGGTFLVVCGISVFGGNDFGGRRYLHNMAVNRGITGTAHQGGNVTAGKLPTSTLKHSWRPVKTERYVLSTQVVYFLWVDLLAAFLGL